MSTMHKKLWAVCAVVIFLAAGCNLPPARPAARSPQGPLVSPMPPVVVAEMPSYPILLTDLPRYQAGLSVPPARSRMLSMAERDLDSPPPAAVRASEPVSHYTPPAAASSTHMMARPPAPAAKPASPKPDTDVQYVP
jgi:hypothetical protein